MAGSVRVVVAAKPDAVRVLTTESQRYEATLALLDERPARLFFEKPLVAMHGQAHVTEDDFQRAREVIRRAAAVGIAALKKNGYAVKTIQEDH